jgi:hypothetical protein
MMIAQNLLQEKRFDCRPGHGLVIDFQVNRGRFRYNLNILGASDYRYFIGRIIRPENSHILPLGLPAKLLCGASEQEKTASTKNHHRSLPVNGIPEGALYRYPAIYRGQAT